MSDLERYQAMTLDYVYGLLDREQVIELEAFLATTPEGEVLRQQADVWKRKLSVAAKAESPNVRFAPPAHLPLAAKRLHAKPQAAVSRSKKAGWTRWAIAASILLVVCGFGIPAARQTIGHLDQAGEVRNAKAIAEKADGEYASYVAGYNARREQSKKDEELAEKEFNELTGQYDDALDKARQAIHAKRLIVRLSGPARAQPGAPNDWRVEVFNRDGICAMPNKIDWSVKDQAGTVVYSDSKQALGKEGFREPPTIGLPISFWEKVKPESSLVLEVTARDDHQKANVNAKISLARPVFVTHLATDKPLYKQGEAVFFRSLTLDRATFVPVDKDVQLEFRVTKPGGMPEPIGVRGTSRIYTDSANPRNQLLGPDKKPLRGIGAGMWDIPIDAPGGEYQLSVVDVTPSIDEVHRQIVRKNVVLETRKFNVVEYKPDTFEKSLEFDGKSYGAGDVVLAKCTASRTQGGKLKRANVEAYATVDGRNVAVVQPGKTDDEGVVRLKLTLPMNITKGEASLTVNFADGSDSEAIVRPIPVVGRIINVEFFPEGGNLIENVPNRVYFQATTHTGKPADLKGFISDGNRAVAEVATAKDADEAGVNRGQGVFTFTPLRGRKYFLKVQKPLNIIEPIVALPIPPRAVVTGLGMANIIGGGSVATTVTTGFELPKAAPDGVVLTALDPVTNPDQPIRVQLQTGKSTKSYLVGAYARGRLIDHRRAEVEPGKPVEVTLHPTSPAGGVTRLTVFEEQSAGEGKPSRLIPRAERLVYRKATEQLLLNISPDKSRYNPGSQVSLGISAFNESEKPIAAVIMAAVVNQSVLTMADEKTGRLMPTHFLLASEVKKPEDLEHADFLLGESPKAAAALDLLLGTQGWRRFAEQHSAPTDPKNKEDVDRLLVSNGQAEVPVETFRQEEEKVVADYQPQCEMALTRLAESQDKNLAIQKEYKDIAATTTSLDSAKKSAQGRYTESLAKLHEFETDGAKTRAVMFAGLCLGLLLIAGACVFVGIARKEKGVPYFATAAGSFAASVLAVVGLVMLGRSDARLNEVAFHNERLKTPDHWAAEPTKATAAEAANENPTNDPAAMREMNDDPKAGALAPLKMENQFGGTGGARAPHPLEPRMMRPDAAVPGGLRAAKMPGPGGRGAGLDDRKRMDDLQKRVQGFDKADKDKDAMKKAEGRLFDGKNAMRNEALNYARGLGAAKERFTKLKQVQLLQRRKLVEANKKVADGQGRATGFGLAAPAPDFPHGKGQPELAGRDLREQLDQIEDMEQSSAFYVREYKFQKDPTSKVRDDFTETVYWHPALVVPDTGRLEVDFQLSDSIARYRVLVAGHTMDGRIGATTTMIEARKPFTVDPKTPIEVTANDRIDVPVRVVNDSDVRRMVTFEVTPNGLTPDAPASELVNGNLKYWLELTANQKGRKVISFKAKKPGEVSLRVLGTSDPVENSDEIVRAFRVVPEGFPASGAASDLLEKRAFANFELPNGIVPGTLKIQLNVYPTTLADLQKGLDGLLREPGGCFEQTSTSNYPNLLILDYLKSSDQTKPEIAQRAKEMLDRGYNKLTSFECPKTGADKQGFEWFGQANRQHQALTAYGLLQFKDLAKVHKVDPELIKRTQNYLMSQRDANGGFARDGAAIDSFGRAPDYITNAYIVWALVESDPDDKEGMDLSKQIARLKKEAKEHAQGKADPYFLALVANALLHRPTNGNREEALAILGRIADKHLKNGCVEGATTSITCSGGRDLQIETTALTVLGWLRCGEPTKFIKPIKESTKWIGQQRGGYGGFGSTQSTILALKALIEHTKQAKKMPEAGEVRLVIAGKTFVKKFTEKDQEVITLDIEKPEEFFKAGKNEASLEITTKESYPFSLGWSCSTLQPMSAEKCAVEVAAKLDRKTAVEGESVRMNVSLRNKLTTGHGMTIAIIGLPGGAKLPEDQKELKKLREDGTISYYEIRGRELILYWRSLKPEEKIDLSVSLICDVPGEYRGPASRGYLYYNADHKHWVEPLSLTIAPANPRDNDDVVGK